MRLPKTARAHVSLLTTLTAAALLAGCAHEPTAPAASTLASQSSKSAFVPTAAQRALVGVSDGTYTFTIDPTQDQSITLGANHLDVPANSICALGTSSYGVQYWNDDCSAERNPVTITAVVRNATTDSPSIDFYPAMRFNPRNNVNLYIYVPTGLHDFAAGWTMKYCATALVCYDESRYDRDLATYVDVDNSMVFRRIKHFSGYVVAERTALDGLGSAY